MIYIDDIQASLTKGLVVQKLLICIRFRILFKIHNDLSNKVSTHFYSARMTAPFAVLQVYCDL